jgi:hypothetical protein
MQLRHLPNHASVEEASEVLREQGCVVIDELMPRETMQHIAADMEEYIEASPVSDHEFGVGARRTGCLIARSPIGRSLPTTPLVLGCAKASLAPSESVIIGATEMITLEPGALAQPLHRDEMLWENFPFPDDINVMMNAMWAVTDFTEENGATRVVPGSHCDRTAEYSPEETVAAEMVSGSVLVYSGKVWHGGGANTTSAQRRGQNVSYAAGWLRQEENQYLACPQEIARTLPEDLLRLMGYDYDALYGYGHAGGQAHPLSVLGRG